jgi:hypothetical protein
VLDGDGAGRAGGRGGPQVLAFFSMVDLRKRLHRDVTERLRADHPSILETAIPSAAEIERMGEARDVVASFARWGRAAPAYEALWADVRRRLSTSLPRP